MLKLSVALVLVALVLGASGRPSQRLTTRALKHADTDHGFFEKLSKTLEKYKVEFMKAIIQGFEEFYINSFGIEHGPQIREIFNKHPQPDYSNDDSVDHYLEKVKKDMEEYAKYKGLSDPLALSEEEDLSDIEV